MNDQKMTAAEQLMAKEIEARGNAMIAELIMQRDWAMSRLTFLARDADVIRRQADRLREENAALKEKLAAVTP